MGRDMYDSVLYLMSKPERKRVAADQSPVLVSLVETFSVAHV